MPRTDKERNIDKVASELVSKPHATIREIAEDTGLGLGTVHRAKQVVEQNGTKDPRIVSLTETDLSIVRKAQELIEAKLNDEELVKNMNIKDISTVAKDSSTRYTIFAGDVTNPDGGLKSIQSMMFDEDV